MPPDSHKIFFNFQLQFTINKRQEKEFIANLYHKTNRETIQTQINTTIPITKVDDEYTFKVVSTVISENLETTQK